MSYKKELAEKIMNQFKAVKGQRSNWEALWQEVVDFTLPRRGNILGKNMSGDSRLPVNLYNSTAIQSNELLAGALHGMLTNPASEFFGLTTGTREIDEMDEVRKWLQLTTRAKHAVLNNSNFQTEIHETYLDLGSIGTSPLEMEEDERDVIRFRARFIAETYAVENNKGIIDSIYRCWEWSARQIVQEYGIENVSPTVAKAYEKDPHEKFEVIQAIYPRSDDEKKRAQVGPLTYAFASVTVLPSDTHTLKESGFQEFPYAMPRWSKASGEVYGRSPGMKALADIKMINAMMRTTIEGAQKAVNPPLMAPDDGFLGPVKTVPGGLNFYRSGTQDRIEPLVKDTRVDFGIQMIQMIQAVIRECYYIDQLQLQDGPQKTATEVNALREEMLRLMGPVLGRLQNELLRPIVDRLFGIMARRNLLPQPIPQILQGRDLRVQYTSLLAKAQRASEAQSLVSAMQLIQPMLAVDPSVADNFHGDNYVRYVHGIFGAPHEILRDKRDVDKIRKAKAQALQKAEAQADASLEAEQAGKIAPLVRETQRGAE